MDLDRDQYPSFETSAAGRIRIKSAGSSGMITNVNLLLSLTKAGKETGAESIEMTGLMFDFDLPIKDLAVGTYDLNATLQAGGKNINTQKKEFIIQEAKAQKSGKVSITVPAFPGSAESWPLTFGVPFPWGALDSEEKVRLINSEGVEIPIQTKVTCRWSKKGSIRWLLVDCIVPARKEEQKFTLEYGPEVQRKAVAGVGLSCIAASAKQGDPGPASSVLRRDASEDKPRPPTVISNSFGCWRAVSRQAIINAAFSPAKQTKSPHSSPSNSIFVLPFLSISATEKWLVPWANM
jgi:hypothetical protein